jgi:hypothetical protein
VSAGARAAATIMIPFQSSRLRTAYAHAATVISEVLPFPREEPSAIWPAHHDLGEVHR